MKRTELEHFKTELSTRYAEQLEREQTHLSDDQRAHMCIGFEHGMGWLFRVLETAGGLKVEPDEPAEQWVCRHCRVVSPAPEWVGEPLRCPRCDSVRETMRPPAPKQCPGEELGPGRCVLNAGHEGPCSLDLSGFEEGIIAPAWKNMRTTYAQPSDGNFRKCPVDGPHTHAPPPGEVAVTLFGAEPPPPGGNYSNRLPVQAHTCGEKGPNRNGRWYCCGVCEAKGCAVCEKRALPIG